MVFIDDIKSLARKSVLYKHKDADKEPLPASFVKLT